MNRLLGFVRRMLGITERRRDDEARVILARGEPEQDERLSKVTGITERQLPRAARQKALRYSAVRAGQRLSGR